MNDNRLHLPRVFRRQLLPCVVIKALSLVKIRIWPFLVFQEHVDTIVQIPFEQSVEDLEVVVLREEQLSGMPPRPGKGNTPENLQRRMDDGNLCVAALVNGTIVAYCWASFEMMDFKAYKVALEECEAYLSDAYTVPQFRGKNLAGHLRCRLYRELEQRGRERFFSITLCCNKPALRLTQKLQSRVVDSGTVLSVAGWSIATRPCLQRGRREP